MSGRLDRLLRPRHVAVIGGGAWGENVIRACALMGFAGKLWPVHPSKRALGGLPAVARIEDLPASPDAAFVAVNREATIDAVRSLAALGAGGAVCFAAGFAEAEAEAAGSGALQERLVAAAGTMPILGPNCYGFINYFDGALLWPDQQGGQRRERGVAVVTQSSNIAINLTMHRRGVPLGLVVTAGNGAQLGPAEIGAALLEDPRVTALGLHLEGIGDAQALASMAARAHALGKPVVVLKVGQSAAGRAASLSHSASVAGSMGGARALFRRLGLAEVSGLSAFLEALKAAHALGGGFGGRLASASCSGGEAGLIADLGAAARLDFPPLDAEQRGALAKVLGPRVRLANPLDYNTYIWPDPARMAAVFAALGRGAADLVTVVLDIPRNDRCDASDWRQVVDAVRRSQAETGRPHAILSTLPETLPEDWAEELMAAGILPLCGMEAGLAGLAALARVKGGPADLRPPAAPADTGAPGRLWDEDRAKTHLARFGLSVPRRRRVASPAAAAEAARALGFPVVLKGLGHAHKTEAGAVRLGLRSARATREAARRMDAPDGYVVEEMVTGALAELMIGVSADPPHGMVLTLAAGGQRAELYGDAAHLLLPARAEEVRAALKGLRLWPVLAGHRGGAPADVAALVAAVMALQDCVLAGRGAILEAEINPLLALPKGAMAVDALIRAREEEIT